MKTSVLLTWEVPESYKSQVPLKVKPETQGSQPQQASPACYYPDEWKGRRHKSVNRSWTGSVGMKYYLNKVRKKVKKWWGVQWSGSKWREEVFRAAATISWGELQVKKEVEEGKNRKNTGSQNTNKWIQTNSSGWGSLSHWRLLKHTLGVILQWFPISSPW